MFIPSLQKNITFLPVTIEQYNSVLQADTSNKRFNLGFNIAFIDTIKNNCTENISITNFDKFIIGLQVFINEVKEMNFNFTDIQHPTSQVIKDNLYTFQLDIPTIEYEQAVCKFILKNNITDPNSLLLCEIAKHLTSLQLDNVNLNLPTNIESKIEILKRVSINSLVLCMEYIDNVKTDIKNYYTVAANDPNLKYSLSLLVP